jgi:hypothetical protein
MAASRAEYGYYSYPRNISLLWVGKRKLGRSSSCFAMAICLSRRDRNFAMAEAAQELSEADIVAIAHFVIVRAG